MDSRVAIIGILLEDIDQSARVNALLHEAGSYIIGRMGIPYPRRNLHIISVAIDAPQDIINELSGKLGRLDGVSVKTLYSRQ